MINDNVSMSCRYTRKLVVYPEKVDFTEFQVFAIASEEMLAFSSKPAFKPVLTLGNGVAAEVAFFTLLFSVIVMMNWPFNFCLAIEEVLPSAYHIHII